jgi:tetratricopeptide (TPR) repeat protein
LFNLDTINLGFIRPQSGLDWQMAYCQAELYAEYMLEKYGDDALAKMLAAYADNLNTRDALKRCFQAEQEEFERGYMEHLKKIVVGLSPDQQPAPLSFAELEKAHRADPKNVDLAARLAHAHLERRSYPTAGKLARTVLQTAPKHQLASYVLARIDLLVGNDEEGMARLESCLDPQTPDENILGLLASLKLKAKAYDEAARLYELGTRKDPANSKWTKGLASVYLISGNNDKLAGILAQLAEKDADDFTVRKKLLQLAVDAKDYAAATKWANQAVQIDVMDPEAHRMFAQALAGNNDFGRAIEEYEVAIKLKPQDGALRLALAQTCVKAKQPQQARAVLEALLKQAPNYPGAEELLESLAP